jgi:hypothetical protein
MTYYFRNTGSTSFNTGTNWSLSSGGASAGVVPGIGDDIIFDANSGACEIDVAGKTVISITFTNYNSTITATNAITSSGNLTATGNVTTTINGSNITVGGNLTTGSLGILTGSSTIVLNGTGIWSSTSFSHYINITINTVGTITISGTILYGQKTLLYTAGTVITTGSTFSITSGNCTLNTSGITWNNMSFQALTQGTPVNNASALVIAGSISNPSGFSVIDGSPISVAGDFSMAGNGFVGTSVITLNGTGVWSGAGTCFQSVTINTAGTITLSGTVRYATGTLTYTAGTVSSAGGTLTINGSCTMNTSGVTWSNITSTAAGGTLTLTSALNVSVAFTITTSLIVNGAFNVNIGGSFTVNTGASISGTSLLLLNGTGTWSTVGNGMTISSVTINTVGTITISGVLFYGSGTLTYIAGTMIVAGSTLSIPFNSTTTVLNTSGMTWNNVLANLNGTMSITSNLNVGGKLTMGNASNLSTGIDGFSIFVTGDFEIGGVSAAGTTTVVMIGTGSILTPFNGTINCNLTFNTAGTITLPSVLRFGTRILTYTTGTVSTVGKTLQLTSSCTLNTSGMTWTTVTTGANMTATLTSNINVSTELSVSGNASFVLTGNTANVSGSLTVGGIMSGTTLILLNGTGTWSGSSAADVRNNLTINTVGTITFSGALSYQTGTMTYIAGTFITTGSTLILASSSTLNVAGISWNDVSSGLSNTIITLTGNLNIGGSLIKTSNTALTFNGVSVVNISGSFSVASTGFVIGTSTVRLVGTGSWSGGGDIRINVTINTAGTVTFSGTNIYRDGTLTYTAGTVITTGSTLNITASCTINTNGVSWNNISNVLTATVTLTSNLTATGTCIIGTSGQSPTFNGFNFYMGGDTTFINANGTTNFILNGTGSVLSTAGTFSNNLEINTAGTITFVGSFRRTGGTLLYTAGTTQTSGSTFEIAGSCTVNTNGNSASSSTLNATGINWNNITTTATVTVTNSSNLVCVGNYSNLGGGTIFNGSNVYFAGGINLNGTMSVGTANLFYVGTGTWSNSNPGAIMNSNFTINTSGTLTMVGTILYANATFTYTAGTVINTGNIFSAGNATTFNTSGMVWNTVRITGALVTINSTLRGTRLEATSNIASYTFGGAAGFDFDECLFSRSTVGTSTVVLTFGNTYRCRNSLVALASSSTSIVLFQSSSGVSRTVFNLDRGASQSLGNLGKINATRIDSSGGQTIFTNPGATLTDTINWNILYPGNFFPFLN